MDKQTFFNLIGKYQDGTASASEKALVEEYYRRLEAMGITSLSVEEEMALKEKMFQQIKASSIDLEIGLQTVDLQSTESSPRVNRIHFRRSRWWAAAAAIIIMLGVGSYFAFFNKGEKKNEIVKTEPAKDIKAPETNRAMITLADGSTVYLDSAGNGQLAVQGNVKLVKLADGKIVYSSESGVVGKEMQYNTLSNPRGSKVIDMTLADGSKVWLNAASSLRFPATFIGNERKVELTGEGYFEVAKNSAMPFKVDIAGKGEVEVLGTHFNINSYSDEASINTTLLEGSVKVTGLTTNDSRLISPGQQAQISSNGQIVVNKNVNKDQVMAWKNGIFNFANADLQMVLRQLSRWYDVDIIVEGAMPQRNFEGEMQRDLNLSQVFKILEKNNVHFRVEGKKLIVTK